MEEPPPLPQILSPSSSGRGRSSPEFEFWMVRNPSNFPQPNLLSADELFSDGFLLPLHLLHISNNSDPPESSGSDRVLKPETPPIDPAADLAATSSKRWTDIFLKNDTNNSVIGKKRKEKKMNGGAAAAGRVSAAAAELNINIWPFSRSRSAGNSGTRPRSTAATANRKVNSAPCSRSNSAGESKSRSVGVHLGRSSPVWQGFVKSAEKGNKKDGNEGRRGIPAAGRGGGGGSRVKVLSLNVPMCIGYRNHLSCRNDEHSAANFTANVESAACRQNTGGVSGEGVRGSNFFSIRSLFTKKVY
ncbi:hypothetical protein ACJIZ3_006667 [Penstemon smallii]|uniref:Uncharacterized protein n=1 Tax=Penstemon smallii TaxID=265156 RepID=A0ABD3S8S3_9LAMI